MAPKHRRVADLEDAPDPKKRVTRSSTKAKAPIQELARSESTKPAQKTSKLTESVSPKARNPAQRVDDQRGEETKDHKTLTIKHDSIKSPITCHYFSPDSKAPPRVPTLIFTHGAGGTLSAPAVVNFCTGYSKDAPILAFQGSMNLKARVKGFHACISHIETTESKAETLVLGGRSMGARAAVIAASEFLSSSPTPLPNLKLILISYPLKGPNEDIRDRILLDLPATVRVLFVAGDKDAMCPLDLLKATREKMAAASHLVVVEGADHGMHVKGRDKEKKMGEESGTRAFDWASGKMEGEMVWIREQELVE